MKTYILLIISFVSCLNCKILVAQGNFCYDPAYVQLTSQRVGNEGFRTISMIRSGGRVNVKYFASLNDDPGNAYKRYVDWARNKNIILVSAGTYYDHTGKTVGLTIDNGVIVSKFLSNELDALVIVYPNGGMVVSNLEDGNLKLNGTGVNSNKSYDIRKSAFDLQTFTNWAIQEKATVFQTHLLVFKNELKVSSYNSKTEPAKRRFLAVGKDLNNTILHVVVDYPHEYSLYQGSKNVLEFLRTHLNLDVIFMLNLDTGSQNVFYGYTKDCAIDKTIVGERRLDEAKNLLAYYFE